jgi:DNA-binding response OmpR family regulator
MSGKNRPRVLVVDDVTDTADSLTILLRLWGYRAEARYDGSAALEAARIFQPQVVLLDLGMPRMDGFRVARLLCEQPATEHAVLIAITGYGNESYRILAQEIGFHHYLLKPVDPDDLLELLIQVVWRPEPAKSGQAGNDELFNGGLHRGKGLSAAIPASSEVRAGETFSLVS